jgi:hypothetical protein
MLEGGLVGESEGSEAKEVRVEEVLGQVPDAEGTALECMSGCHSSRS